MDHPQVTSQLEHLEQRLQASLQQIAKLQQHVESQEYQLQEKTRQIENLEAEVAQTQAELTHLPDVNEQLTALKEEMLEMFERRSHRYEPVSLPASSPNLLNQQLDNQTRALNDLRRQVEKTERFDEQIMLARTETTRLNKAVAQFEAKLDVLKREFNERIKPLYTLEDQRRVDIRILTQLQAELPKLRDKIETNLTKIQIVEQKIPQYARYEAALEDIRDDIRRHREHMDYQIAQRERQLKDYSDLAEKAEQHIKDSRKEMGKYTEHYQLNKRALASLQDFQERLQNEQHRFGELQRLAEERQRAEFEKFQADLEQRWQKKSRELEPHFENFQRSIEILHKRIDEVAKFHAGFEEQLQLLMQIIEEDMQARALATNAWQQRFEEIANGQS